MKYADYTMVDRRMTPYQSGSFVSTFGKNELNDNTTTASESIHSYHMDHIHIHINIIHENKNELIQLSEIRPNTKRMLIEIDVICLCFARWCEYVCLCAGPVSWIYVSPSARLNSNNNCSRFNFCEMSLNDKQMCRMFPYIAMCGFGFFFSRIDTSLEAV